MTNSLTWRPDIHLPRATIRIADVAGDLTPHESWRATLEGHLYLLAGTSTAAGAEHRVTGYAGITEHHGSGRPWASLTHWVRNARALRLDALALVTLHEPSPDPDVLRILECAVIRRLNVRTQMLNTMTAAPSAAAAVGAAASAHAAHGRFLATVLQHHVMRGRANPLLTPASTLRETSVRVVLASDRALDTADVIARVSALCGDSAYRGLSVGATLRRDLTLREAGRNAGQPRVLSTHVAGRCLYYSASVPRATAVARYLARQQQLAA